MAFTSFFASVRKIGRTAVLPVEKIKTIISDTLAEKNISAALDFGAGTLFWTDWFVHKFKIMVYAVDVYYDSENMPAKEKVFCYSSLQKCLEENKEISFLWACDVLHHLTPLDTEAFLKAICNKTDIIIIKDIDANHKFGNFMNKIHDKIINNETIYDINPNSIDMFLMSQGFKTIYHFVPKIWYPHFVLVAIR